MKIPVAVLLAGLTAAFSASGADRLTRLSDHYEVEFLPAGLRYQARLEFSLRESGARTVLGVANASQYVERHFGLTSRLHAVSADGLRLLYTHNPGVAGNRIQKQGGVYLHRVGEGEQILFAENSIGGFWRSWPKPLPPHALVVIPRGTREGPFQRVTPMLVTTEGISYPLGLHDLPKLAVAAWHGDTNRISRQMEAGDSPASTGYFGYTAFEIAALQGHEEAALTLARAGPASIHTAALFRHPRVVRLLVERDPTSINRKDERGDTPLHALFRRARVHEAALLWGESAALNAFASNDLDMIKLLVEAGADPNLYNDEGRTPLLQALQSMSPNPDFGFVAALLEAGMRATVAGRDGNTPLHILAAPMRDERRADNFAKTATPRTIELLAQVGAPVNTRRSDGMTPLQIAVQLNNLRTAELLIGLGADSGQPFIHGGVGPPAKGESVLERIRSVQQSPWWRER